MGMNQTHKYMLKLNGIEGLRMRETNITFNNNFACKRVVMAQRRCTERKKKIAKNFEWVLEPFRNLRTQNFFVKHHVRFILVLLFVLVGVLEFDQLKTCLKSEKTN